MRACFPTKSNKSWIDEGLILLKLGKVLPDRFLPRSIIFSFFPYRKEDLEINEQLREQGADLESKRELYISQSRVLKDEISTIKSELRERRDRIEKLKVKYDLTVKAMGEPEISSELLPSHARHMVKVAQEKSELLGKYIPECSKTSMRTYLGD